MEKQPQQITDPSQIEAGQLVNIDIMEGSAIAPYYEKMKVEQITNSFIKIIPTEGNPVPMWLSISKLRDIISNQRITIL